MSDGNRSEPTNFVHTCRYPGFPILPQRRKGAEYQLLLKFISQDDFVDRFEQTRSKVAMQGKGRVYFSREIENTASPLE